MGSQLLGNYILGLADFEHHENWRGLYRLPPRVINALRETRIDHAWRDWIRALPKADLHRHLGGCLNIAGHRVGGQAIWSAMTKRQRDEATGQIRGFLDQSTWPTNWPQRLRNLPIPRPHSAAALLVHGDDACLQHNLDDCTAPRVALKERHELRFAAYELPCELSGSSLLAHQAAISTAKATLRASSGNVVPGSVQIATQQIWRTWGSSGLNGSGGGGVLLISG